MDLPVSGGGGGGGSAGQWWGGGPLLRFVWFSWVISLCEPLR